MGTTGQSWSIGFQWNNVKLMNALHMLESYLVFLPIAAIYINLTFLLHQNKVQITF